MQTVYVSNNKAAFILNLGKLGEFSIYPVDWPSTSLPREAITAIVIRDDKNTNQVVSEKCARGHLKKSDNADLPIGMPAHNVLIVDKSNASRYAAIPADLMVGKYITEGAWHADFPAPPKRELQGSGAGSNQGGKR